MDEINCEIASASAAWGAGEAGWMRVTFFIPFSRTSSESILICSMRDRRV